MRHTLVEVRGLAVSIMPRVDKVCDRPLRLWILDFREILSIVFQSIHPIRSYWVRNVIHMVNWEIFQGVPYLLTSHATSSSNLDLRVLILSGRGATLGIIVGSADVQFRLRFQVFLVYM